MRISHSSYSEYISKIGKDLIGEKLHSPILLNNRTIVFPFMERLHEVVVVSLNVKTPVLFMTKSDCFFSSFENQFLNRFRKYIGKTQIKGIKLKKDDLVLELVLESLEENEEYKLVIELIPNCPNIYILDSENRLKESYYKTKNRDLKNNEEFIPLKNEKFIDGEIVITEEFLKQIFDEEFVVRNKEKYAGFIKYINSKIRTNEKKIKNIENDVKIAGKNLIFQEIADDIFASGLNLKSHHKSYIFNGDEYALDEAKTLLENAQHFYKKAKKAKETISRSNINIENARKEIAEFMKILDDFSNGNEKKKDELVMLFVPSKRKKETKLTILNRPWKINYNGTIIYFGRNASQNDYLSFAMKLDREFTWLHIKDKSGAHLVIANKKPTESELLLASELSLLCSHVTSGEIVYTKKKSVRRGHVLGEALLKTYSTIKLNSVRKETIEIFESAVRCD